MELDKIIEAAKGKELGSDVIDAIKKLDRSGDVERLESELESERGKNAAILADKKKYKEERDALKATIDKIETDKLPEDEKRQKEIQDLQTKLEEAQKQRDADAAKFAQTQRENKLLELTGKINWSKETPASTRNLIIKNALAEIEDLSDESKVEDVLKSVTESHKSFIVADAAGGSGSKAGGEGGGGEAKSSGNLILDEVNAAWGKK